MRWSLVLVRALAVLALWIGGDSGVFSQNPCHCSTRDLCQPIPADHQYQVEVMVFYHGGTDWIHYDWSKVTTVVALNSPQADLVCHAHANKVRVVLKESIEKNHLIDSAKQHDWINSQLRFIKLHFMDGINLDLMETISSGHELTQLLRQTTTTFHLERHGSQVTFNVPWTPNCPGGNCLDYVEMANSTDFLVVKSFDVKKQLWGECFANANAPYHQVYSGLSAYINMGVDSRKLVMTVPWFGYDYPCQHLYEPSRCELRKVPFSGAACSPHIGKKISYKEIMQQLPRSITGRYWDDDYKSPYYVYMVNNTYHEVWYDDPESISLKSSILKKLKLRGIGAWTGNFLNYTADPTVAMQSEEMWNALCPIRGKWRT
ncbi:di-N-acetylchitobiase-like [Heterodontus francisci]|uniref:di-N-acetylchitobiase-like n=1 Tax=Heterodontus francisci TaxID=7792 RepID=UPI00355B6701